MRDKTCRPRTGFCCSEGRSAGADAAGKDTGRGGELAGAGGLCKAGPDRGGERGGRAEPRSAHTLLLPPASPWPLRPPMTRRAHPGHRQLPGAGAMPARGWAQGSGCPVPTASASPEPGTRAPSRYPVVTDATSFYFNRNGTRSGYPHASTGVCVWNVNTHHWPGSWACGRD